MFWRHSIITLLYIKRFQNQAHGAEGILNFDYLDGPKDAQHDGYDDHTTVAHIDSNPQ
jgi:hypothetical protein